MNNQTSQPSSPVSAPTTPTTPAAVARVMSTVAKAHGGQVPRGSHVGRMQAAVARGPFGGVAGSGGRR